MTSPLPTANARHGFFGTFAREGMDATTAWNTATAMIADVVGSDPDTLVGIRDFLDSRWGRHFADMVLDRLQQSVPIRTAIKDAIKTHQGWTIGEKTEADEGIPAGLPWLTGWVIHFAIAAEA